MTPRPYQIVGRDFLASRRHALLADEMRVGKTPQAILAAEKLSVKSIIVVCPAIATTHWLREFDKWWCDGAYQNPKPSLLSVISYDRFRRYSTQYLSQRWDLAIVDEAHFAKNPEAQRTQLIYGKGGLGWVSDRMWALSGTPAPKHAGELYPMLKAFGVVGMTYSQFVSRYCTLSWDRKITGTNTYRIPELKELLAKVMLRRTRKEVAPDMPAIGFEFLEVDPVSRADLTVPAGLDDEQLLAYLDRSPADRQDRVEVAKAKALPLVENVCFAIENRLLKQTVVFGWHIEALEMVLAGLRARGISAALLNGGTAARERQEIQDDFRKGLLQAVVANIQAAGTAIDLSAASHGFFLELWWVGSDNLQAANRLVSMQKDEPVTFDIVTWPGSIDDRVQRVLLRRARELNQLY
jgi:SNF2 family DNA or RNA helicase